VQDKDGNVIVSKEAAILRRLRAVCLALPEANEVKTWGHPTFRAGKRAFAVLEPYDGMPSLAVRVGLARQEELLADSRFFETPYCGHRGWVSLQLNPSTDWDQVNGLLLEGYRLVALNRMVRALEGQQRHGR
jgi:predicted DNA-binding protein (MmcQ/YjbR family)